MKTIEELVSEMTVIPDPPTENKRTEYISRKKNKDYGNRKYALILLKNNKCSCLNCPMHSKCKKRDSFKLHNLGCSITNFMYRIGWKTFHFPLQIGHAMAEDLSGTDQCPYHIKRIYGCYQCKYLSFDNEDYDCIGTSCACRERFEDMKNDTLRNRNSNESILDVKGTSIGYTQVSPRCPYFELSEYGNDYDRHTGEQRFMSPPDGIYESEIKELDNNPYLRDLLIKRLDKIKQKAEETKNGK